MKTHSLEPFTSLNYKQYNPVIFMSRFNKEIGDKGLLSLCRAPLGNLQEDLEQRDYPLEALGLTAGLLSPTVHHDDSATVVTPASGLGSAHRTRRPDSEL